LLEINGFHEEFALTLLVTPQAYRALNFNSLSRWRDKVSIIQENASKYSFNEYFILPLKKRKLLQKMAIFHSPHFTLPYFMRIPTVVTIHDLIHLHYPRKSFHKPIVKGLVWSSLKRANHVITVSAESKSEINKTFAKTSVPISVIHNGVRLGVKKLAKEELDTFLKKVNLNRQFCLFVGSDRPHKGFRECILAWKRLKEHSSDIPMLVVVGKDYSNETVNLVSKLGLDDDVYFYGDATMQDLVGLYNIAQAVLVPSKAEGFGLVALEALVCGTPVICSPINALKEVCKDYALYSHTCSDEDIFRAVENMLANYTEAKRRAEQATDYANSFSRTTVAKQTLEVYCSILSAQTQRTRTKNRVNGQTAT
jgi:glycosyltransferase involved in cell wall biosynthesis